MKPKAKIFLPQGCIFCYRNACAEELPICHNCIRHLYNLFNYRCNKCSNLPGRCTCKETDKIRFLFFFDSIYSRKLIYEYKYDADKRMAKFLGELLVRNCGLEPKAFDGITYVPRSKRNIKRYGYDQSKLLASAISELYGIPLVTALKRKKTKREKDQKLLNIIQRKRNVSDKYELAYVPQEKFKRLLLVDDVTTTGATVNVCADMLRKDFTKIVTIAVLAKTNTFKK